MSATPPQNAVVEPGSETAPRDPLSIPPDIKASLRVLVVDDDRTLREGCASVLQLDGYNVSFIGRVPETLVVTHRSRNVPADRVRAPRVVGGTCLARATSL